MTHGKREGSQARMAFLPASLGSPAGETESCCIQFNDGALNGSRTAEWLAAGTSKDPESEISRLTNRISLLGRPRISTAPTLRPIDSPLPGQGPQFFPGWPMLFSLMEASPISRASFSNLLSIPPSNPLLSPSRHHEPDAAALPF